MISDEAASIPPPPDRLISLDLIRGIAVLGILAVNIAGFAGPSAALLTPNLPYPGPPPASFADNATFAAIFVLFEGKMRTLFAILFGASMALFIDRAEAAGRDGDGRQLLRLFWLMLFGLLHYFLLWWGDILFLYALTGIIALFMRELPVRTLVISALVLFAGWHLAGAVDSLPRIAMEERIRIGTASPDEVESLAGFHDAVEDKAARDLAGQRAGFAAQVTAKLLHDPLHPLESALPNLPEVLSLMLIGMALYRSGFFAGHWPRAWLNAMAAGGLLLGGGATLAITGWLWPRQFPLGAMNDLLLYGLALPHLLMALGYAALLVMAAPALARTRLGARLTAAGRMAFSNYIATSLLMTAIFYGWGLGLIGTLGHATFLPFVLLGWLAMLAWSAPWLDRFRQGPLEWLWRSLTERRALPFLRE